MISATHSGDKVILVDTKEIREGDVGGFSVVPLGSLSAEEAIELSQKLLDEAGKIG